MSRYFNDGVTLVELLVVLAVLAILLMAGTGFTGNMIDRARVIRAAEAVRDHLQFSRSEAIKQTRAVTVTYQAGVESGWRLGSSDEGTCDVTLSDAVAANACALHVGEARVLTILDGGQFSQVTMQATRPATRFNPINGTALGTNASVILRSPRQRELRVIVSNIGRIRTCSPSGSAYVAGYTAC